MSEAGVELFLFSVPVRLGIHGQSKAEGYVEALGLNSRWGGICEDGFSINEAHIVCKMLADCVDFSHRCLVFSRLYFVI